MMRSKFIDTSNRYDVNSTGSFVINVYHLSENVGRFHPMKLDEKLFNIGED